MVDPDPFNRSPANRGYRISSLAKAVEVLGRNVEDGLIADPVTARPGDGAAIAELAEAIHEETEALIEALEKADSATRAAQPGGPSHD